MCHSHHLTCANIRSKYFAGEDNAHFFKINLIMSRSSLHGFDAPDGSRSTPEPSHGSMLQTENQIIPLSVTPARCRDVMTKVSLVCAHLSLNGSKCPNQTSATGLHNPTARGSDEIYWTWPINGLRHVLRNNQFGPLMNSLEFFRG